MSLAIGVDLHLLRPEEGGRTKPVGTVPQQPFSFRPNWRWGEMASGVQVPGAVAWLGTTPLQPGSRTRAVVVSPHPGNEDLWRGGGVGNEISMMEGLRVVGHGVVEWMIDTTDDANEWNSCISAFRRWCEGGPRPT